MPQWSPSPSPSSNMANQIINGQVYFIVNKKSGTAFDLSGEDERSIIGFRLHRGDNQKVRRSTAIQANHSIPPFLWSDLSPIAVEI